MKTVGYLSALLHLGICRMLRSVLGNSGRKAGGRLPNRPVSAAELSKKLTVRRILVSRGGGELADLDVANDGARGKRFCNDVRKRRVI